MVHGGRVAPAATVGDSGQGVRRYGRLRAIFRIWRMADIIRRVGPGRRIGGARVRRLLIASDCGSTDIRLKDGICQAPKGKPTRAARAGSGR